MSETRIPEALALLREKGWCRGVISNNRGEHCIIGATWAAHDASAESLTPTCWDDERALREVVLAQHGTRSIADFNDDPATTFADVEFVLEKAILERGGAL